MAVVGGMSIEKQERLLTRGVDVIIATPGRFWELISDSQNEVFALLNQTVRYLVLDEADRMVEQGHFRDLDSILNTLKQKQ
jgi:ATP-dependent RNA helicase DDX24/MAK5